MTSELEDSSSTPTTSTNTNTNDKKKKEAASQPGDDLVLLNESETLTVDTVPQEDADTPKQDYEFNIKDFPGFPMDDWIRYQGSINDNRQKRRVSIASHDKFTMRYNRSGDDDIPEWDILTLQYYPITVKAWQKRQSDVALLEDKQRELGALDLQLSEIQSSIRERIMSNKTISSSKHYNNNNNINLNLEDLQKNVNLLSNLQKNMKQELQTIKNDADRYAFKIYFHRPDEFEKIRADDLDDIIGACDWKQVNGPANLRPSKSSATGNQPGIT